MLTIQMKLVDVSESSLTGLMPTGYWVEALEGHRYVIKSDSGNAKVGHCVVNWEMVDISFYEDEPTGFAFASEFGLKHPDNNPNQILFGIVYSLGRSVYQLDKQPLSLRGPVEAEFDHYKAAGNAFFVIFRRGNWGKTWVTVDEMRKICSSGRLGHDVGPIFLALGEIENESTM